MTTKAQYEAVANTINKALAPYNAEGLEARVDVLDTSDHGYGFSKYSLVLNDDAWELIKGSFNSKSVRELVDGEFTANGRRFYLEPVTSTCYDLAAL